MALAGITQHLLGAHKPFSHVQPQVFHSPPRPTALEDRNLEKKGLLLLGVLLVFPREGTKAELWVGGQLLILVEQLPSPKEQAQALQPGMGSLLPVLHPALTSNSLECSSQTQNSHEDRQNLSPYIVKKSSSISCSSPQACFMWGVRVSGFWYLHSSFSGTSYRCGLNENMFGFRRDPSRGMGRKNLSIIFSRVRQLPLPSGGGFGGQLVACGELEQEQGWFFKMLEQQSFQFSAEIVELGAGLWKCHVPQLAQSSPGVKEQWRGIRSHKNHFHWTMHSKCLRLYLGDRKQVTLVNET